MAKLGPLVRVKAIAPLEGFTVRVEFEDGTQKQLDLQPYLRGPIFEPIGIDPIMFRSMKVWDGTITWDNGADIDPDVLYYDELKPAWMEEPKRGWQTENWPNQGLQLGPPSELQGGAAPGAEAWPFGAVRAIFTVVQSYIQHAVGEFAAPMSFGGYGAAIMRREQHVAHAPLRPA
jgi:hypothetical protein